MNQDMQAKFEEVQTLLRDAAQGIQELLGGDSIPPPAAKARYESITKIEECYMWMANGVQSLLQLDSKIEQAAAELAHDQAKGKASKLKVVK